MKNILLPLFCITFLLSAYSQMPCNVLVGYYQTSWGAYVPIASVNSNYNVIMLSFFEAGGGDGNSSNNNVNSLSFYATNNALLKQQIPQLQAAGKKVLMSIGGGVGSFKLNSDADMNTFVSKTKTIIQTYGVDGIDIDLENPVYLNQNQGGTISNPEAHIQRIITALQQLLSWYQQTYGKKMLLTLVPEVAYTVGGLSSYMSSTYGVPYLAIIEALKTDIDLVMVQLYNASGGSYGLNNQVYNQGTADFIVSQTEAMIKGFTCKNGKGVYSGLNPSQVAVCLPASQGSAPGGGYASPTVVKQAMDYLRGIGPKPGNYTLQKADGYPDLAGMATWSINEDMSMAGYSYATNYASMFTNCLSTDVQVAQQEKSFNVYPNSAQSEITVSGNFKGENLKIYNQFGQIVFQQIVNENTRIELSSFSSGLYIIDVAGEVEKLVVQ